MIVEQLGLRQREKVEHVPGKVLTIHRVITILPQGIMHAKETA
jgi:hypothetical protein